MQKKENKIKIGMVLTRDFPPDDRPEKEALSLIENGFEVNLLSYTDTGKPLHEDYKGIKITRFKMAEKVHKKFSAAYLVLPVYKKIWQKQMEKFILDNEINILHIHDLPLTDVALALAEKYNLKVVADQHEYWSNWIGHTAHYNTMIGKMVKFLSNWKRYEAKNLRKVDLVITIEEPLRQQYIKEIGIDPNKIICVPNTPSEKVFNLKNVDSEIVDKYRDNFVIFYAGAIDILRGLDMVVRALPQIEEHIPNVKFLLAGRFAKNCRLMSLAEELNVSKKIEFLGWLPVDNLPSYILASEVCVHLPKVDASEEVNNTIATKIYQYAILGKPIVVSKAKMMTNFVESNGLGYSVEESDIDKFVSIVTKIFINTEERKRIYLNSRKIADNIIWERTINELIKRYNNFKRNIQ